MNKSWKVRSFSELTKRATDGQTDTQRLKNAQLLVAMIKLNLLPKDIKKMSPLAFSYLEGVTNPLSPLGFNWKHSQLSCE
jgi:hypothetical protein